eukprot:COSAG06_NODE_7264_length_2566_cov_1.912850_3_plen_244_part_00
MLSRAALRLLLVVVSVVVESSFSRLWCVWPELADPDSLQLYDTEGWVPPARVQDVVDVLESNAEGIRAEWAEAVRMTSDNPNFGMFFQSEKESLAERAGSWREFELWRGGQELKYCSVFKNTCDVLRRLPEAVKFRGSVKFSTMEPGTVVRPHFAISNDHLRLHLGIDVPEPDETDLIVGGVRRGWQQDKVIVFDDSIIHAVRVRPTCLPACLPALTAISAVPPTRARLQLTKRSIVSSIVAP